MFLIDCYKLDITRNAQTGHMCFTLGTINVIVVYWIRNRNLCFVAQFYYLLTTFQQMVTSFKRIGNLVLNRNGIRGNVIEENIICMSWMFDDNNRYVLNNTKHKVYVKAFCSSWLGLQNTVFTVLQYYFFINYTYVMTMYLG